MNGLPDYKDIRDHFIKVLPTLREDVLSEQQDAFNEGWARAMDYVIGHLSTLCLIEKGEYSLKNLQEDGNYLNVETSEPRILEVLKPFRFGTGRGPERNGLHGVGDLLFVCECSGGDYHVLGLDEGVRGAEGSRGVFVPDFTFVQQSHIDEGYVRVLVSGTKKEAPGEGG